MRPTVEDGADLPKLEIHILKDLDEENGATMQKLKCLWNSSSDLNQNSDPWRN